MKTKIALAASVILNALLLAVLLGYYRPRANWPRELPEQKPDFKRIRTALEEELARPSNAQLFELMHFESREWLCRAEIREKYDKPTRAHWRKKQAIVDAVSRKCTVPGRQAGWCFDPDDPRRWIGATIEFGYSTEVGYALRNEFREE